MKAVLCLLLLSAVSGHLLQKRSLLGGKRHGGAGHHHRGAHHAGAPHGHHAGGRQGGRHGGGHHAGGRRQGLAKRLKGRRGGERAGRDGGHAHEDPPPAESRALSAPTDSYLPAADDYDYQEDSLAGYDPSQEERALDKYNEAESSGDQSQYQEPAEEEEGSTDVSGATAARSTEAGSGYGAPGAEAGSGEEVGSGDAAARAEDDYAAPEGGYGAPAPVTRTEEEYGAPGSGDQSSYNNGFPFESVENGNQRAGGSGGQDQCPGGSIEACVGVCPGSSTRVYGACVRGCDSRCPE